MFPVMVDFFSCVILYVPLYIPSLLKEVQIFDTLFLWKRSEMSPCREGWELDLRFMFFIHPIKECFLEEPLLTTAAKLSCTYSVLPLGAFSSRTSKWGWVLQPANWNYRETTPSVNPKVVFHPVLVYLVGKRGGSSSRSPEEHPDPWMEVWHDKGPSK